MAFTLDGTPTIVDIDRGLWAVDVMVKSFPLRHMPWRMTVIDGESQSLVHSPVPLDDDTWSKVRSRLKENVHVLAPNEAHHSALSSFFSRCAADAIDAKLWLAPRLRTKLERIAPGLPLDAASELMACMAPHASFADELGEAVELQHLAGVPGLNEVVLFHRPTKTLIVTDAIVNVPEHPHGPTRAIFKMIRAYGGPKQPVLWRLRAKDRAALLVSVRAVLAWPFERVICAHGEVLEEGGREAFEEVFAWARGKRTENEEA